MSGVYSWKAWKKVETFRKVEINLEDLHHFLAIVALALVVKALFKFGHHAASPAARPCRAQGRSASGAVGLIANPPGPVKNKLLSQNWCLDPFKL